MKRFFIIILCLIVFFFFFKKSDVKTSVETALECRENVNIKKPSVEYELINDFVSEKIDEYLKIFRENITDTDFNQECDFNVEYNSFEYKNYLSYVFNVNYFTKGAHPAYDIFTVCYDKKKNKIVSIKDLMYENKNLLKNLSEYTRDVLMKDKRIISLDMLFFGTEAKEKNFSKFAFSKDGFIVFFTVYEVAPFSQGEFEVVIPYNKIKI